MHILISAGPTVEDIDPVRFISNRATGKLGVAIARAALEFDHTVTLVHGPLGDSVMKSVEALTKIGNGTLVSVRSAAEMRAAMLKHLPKADVIVMNAAVADFTPVKLSSDKLKKASSGLTLALKPTPDILKELGRKRRKNQVLIGFALETGSGKTAKARAESRLAEAGRKLREKNADIIVLDTPEAMGSDRAHFTLVDRYDVHDAGVITKKQLAELLMALVTPCEAHGEGCGCER